LTKILGTHLLPSCYEPAVRCPDRSDGERGDRARVLWIVRGTSIGLANEIVDEVLRDNCPSRLWNSRGRRIEPTKCLDDFVSRF